MTKNNRAKIKNQSQTPYFTLVPGKDKIPFSPDQTILDALLAAEIEIDHSCGGMGSCGTCHIFVENCELERNEVENEMALDRKFQKNERLACQNLASTELKVRLP